MTLPRNKLVTLTVTLVGAAVVAALWRFNHSTSSYNQYLVGNMMGLMWVPMLTVLVFQENPENFGFRLGVRGKTWAVVGVIFAAMMLVLFIVHRWGMFQSYYPIFRRFDEFRSFFTYPVYPRDNPYIAAPMLMLYAEASYGMYMFFWEFFFRGYLLFGLARSIGMWAVLVQALGFGLLHFGKPMPEVVASFGAGVALGLLALSAKSFVPCFVLHWAVSLAFNLMVVGGRPH